MTKGYASDDQVNNTKVLLIEDTSSSIRREDTSLSREEKIEAIIRREQDKQNKNK